MLTSSSPVEDVSSTHSALHDKATKRPRPLSCGPKCASKHRGTSLQSDGMSSLDVSAIINEPSPIKPMPSPQRRLVSHWHRHHQPHKAPSAMIGTCCWINRQQLLGESAHHGNSTSFEDFVCKEATNQAVAWMMMTDNHIYTSSHGTHTTSRCRCTTRNSINHEGSWVTFASICYTF